MDLRRPTGKSHKIADAVRAEILSGKLRPGNRLESVRALARHFSVSLKAAQVAVDMLAKEGVVEKKRGAGTWVKRSPPQNDNTIYFLVPNASHLALGHETSVMLRHILYGITSATAPGQLVQVLPVSKTNTPSITKNPGAIDWTTLDRIPSGASVFVSGAWYAKIIPFLVERGIRGVFMSDQFEQNYPDVLKGIQQGGWHVVTLDRRAAIRRVVEHLYATGAQRVAALKCFPNEPEHPFRLGFIDGIDVCQPPFDPRFFHEYPAGHEDQWGNMIGSFWEQTQFDALIVCSQALAKTALSVLAGQKKLNIPGAAAVIAYRNLPEHMDLTPPLSAFDFAWKDIGEAITRLFNNNPVGAHTLIFQSSIIERGSSCKLRNEGSPERFSPEWLPSGLALPEMA